MTLVSYFQFQFMFESEIFIAPLIERFICGRRTLFVIFCRRHHHHHHGRNMAANDDHIIHNSYILRSQMQLVNGPCLARIAKKRNMGPDELSDLPVYRMQCRLSPSK